ncbi:hypothetical protein [Pseudanabaena sp. UWO310]|uniref:hypothetical protein n=1 Tax=Pseudanabaena sp. UWO310 TaxID=2480795 RepID=UPI00115ACDB5|nr:hypothetical protein [Pseudanabaena sp. UWO310]TYQ29827.1 hypothetical protein PseudUWO310_12000 [Pseudanabaena sp. UWO310]
MITIDEDKYPLVSINFGRKTTLEGTKKYLSYFDKWLSQEQKFGLILNQANAPQDLAKQDSAKQDLEQIENDPEEIEAVHQLTVHWAKEHKPQITLFCVGIALVVEEHELGKRQKAAPKTIAGLFGCMGQVFANPLAAEQWLRSLL